MLRHVISVSWGDHLLFGQDDGRLATPEAVARRMERWRDALGAGVLHWRLHHRSRVAGRFQAARGRTHPSLSSRRGIDWCDLTVVPRVARAAGLEPYLYVTLFDEGWPLTRPSERQVSYHNAMHGQHVAWQSEFSRVHPEYATIDRLRRRQWGVLCLAYPEVRRHFRARYLEFLRCSDFAGLFLCLRSQSRPAGHADQYGFNDPVRRDFLLRTGQDIRSGDFDVQVWRDLQGDYLTELLRELRSDLRPYGWRLAVGAPRGDVLGPPLGNASLHWRTWIREGLIDDLVINQNSSQCPSMWHQLWPMHRGYGYVQNYLDGQGMAPLPAQIESAYGPVVEGSGVRLYVARQWDGRNEADERALVDLPGVAGLVFSSFRFDNPEAVARGEWTA